MCECVTERERERLRASERVLRVCYSVYVLVAVVAPLKVDNANNSHKY